MIDPKIYSKNMDLVAFYLTKIEGVIYLLFYNIANPS